MVIHMSFECWIQFPPEENGTDWTAVASPGLHGSTNTECVLNNLFSNCECPVTVGMWSVLWERTRQIFFFTVNSFNLPDLLRQALCVFRAKENNTFVLVWGIKIHLSLETRNRWYRHRHVSFFKESLSHSTYINSIKNEWLEIIYYYFQQ